MTTVRAPTNIAFIKYWGKNPVWEEYHIPTKSSLSFTVEGLYTETTVNASPGNGKVSFELNGKLLEPGAKEFAYIDKFFRNTTKIFPFLNNYDYEIKSTNNFPTAAGFASSASGFAALAKAVAYEVEEFKDYRDDKHLSAIARLGSGSASRSIPEQGGLVLWKPGMSSFYAVHPSSLSHEQFKQAIFSSYAESLLPADYWPELRIIYVKVEQSEKKIKSRAGMKTSMRTNPLYWRWVEHEESQLLPEAINSVKERNFFSFANIVMRASNNLHAICQGTYPAIMYLNDTSKRIINNIHELNEEEIKAAYTFDAGPNAVVFTLDIYANDVLSMLSEIVGKKNLILSKPGEGPKIIN